MSGRPLAFPAWLRPPTARRRRRLRRRLLLAAAVLLTAVTATLTWRIHSVTVSAYAGYPPETVRALRGLVGTPVVLLSLRRVRHLAQLWPGTAAVEVRLELPGRLLVTIHPAPVAGSLAIGRGWHAVGADGVPGRRLEGPVPPVLERFPMDTAQLREGLVIADRLATETGRKVLRVRKILPGDLQVELAGASPGKKGAVVHVRPSGSRAERWWTARFRTGRIPGPWADLTRDDRATVGGRG